MKLKKNDVFFKKKKIIIVEKRLTKITKRKPKSKNVEIANDVKLNSKIQ